MPIVHGLYFLTMLRIQCGLLTVSSFILEIKVHEVTWYLWVVGGCAAAFLVMITLSVVVPYYMWKRRVVLIMKIVHYFQAYEDDGKLVT